MRRPKTLKAAKKRAWAAISKNLRQKHAVRGICRCVTCDASHRWQDMHLGHFQHGLTVGMDADGQPFVWEENLHPQCAGCNTFRGGMLDRYALYMVDMYGREFVDSLVSERYKPVKLKIDDWWEIEKRYAEEH